MKTPPAIEERERRFTAGKVEVRADGDGKVATVRGYAAMFDRRSENLGGFVEIIKRGAFDDVLRDDVRALFNHDANLILARSKNGEGTLRFGADDAGLWYEFTPPDTQAGRDLVVSLKRGDVDQSSFAFSVRREGQEWKDEQDGKLMVRTITKVARLYDVSPVTYPAYPDTTVATRSLDEFRKEATPAPAITTAESARRARELQLAEAEL